MTHVFLVQGEHFSNPGNPMKVFATEAGAAAEAASLVNLLLDWVDLPKDATAENWEAKLLEARQKRAADFEIDDLDDLEEDDGDVWVTKMEVGA
jgi:hypothetical protein